MIRMLIISFCCLHLFANAQSEIQNPLKDDTFFKVSKSIDAWANESAIVLAQKTLLTVKAKEYKWAFEQTWTTRKKILLQDKAAVEFWSNLKLDDYDYFEMTIDKPNGKSINIDSNDFIAVNEHFSASSFAVDESYELFQYYKLAVENLSIGDVIDLTYQVKKQVITSEVKWVFPLRKQNTWKNFSSFTYFLNEQYPKQKEQYEIVVDPRIYISAKAYNGFKKIIEENTPTHQKRLVFEKFKVQTVKDVYFSNQKISGPKLLIELSYCQAYRYYRSPLLLGAPGQPINELNEDKLKRTLFMDFHPSLEGNVLGIKSSETQTKLLIADIYSKYQKRVFNSETADFLVPSYEMASNFYSILRSNGLAAEMVVSMPKQFGSISHLISTTHLEFAVRVPVGDGGYYYIYNFSKFSTWQDQNASLTGNQAFVFVPAKKYKEFYFEQIELPQTTAEANGFNVKTDLEIDLDNGTTLANVETELKGLMRNEFAFNLLSIEDYGYVTDFSQFDEFKLNRYYARIIEKDLNRRNEYLSNWVNEDFELSEYYEFKLIKSGFEKDNVGLVYKEKYTLNDLVHSVGDGDFVVFDLGKIITGQVALTQSENKRDVDVVVEYPKQYEYEVYLKIPIGWKVGSLDALNIESNTPAGSFKSICTLLEKDGKNCVYLKTTKTYEATFLPKENWSYMQEFLDAAFHFSQQKIVFEKE